MTRFVRQQSLTRQFVRFSETLLCLQQRPLSLYIPSKPGREGTQSIWGQAHAISWI